MQCLTQIATANALFFTLWHFLHRNGNFDHDHDDDEDGGDDEDSDRGC